MARECCWEIIAGEMHNDIWRVLLLAVGSAPIVLENHSSFTIVSHHMFSRRPAQGIM
jgi:hypothetical protein